ncbi:MAG: hypothetical protein MJ158_02000 [Alphaproteobacteria bacterium]|nr:hypothetical protein [Alphaproteobacteria bacterium]
MKNRFNILVVLFMLLPVVGFCASGRGSARMSATGGRGGQMMSKSSVAKSTATTTTEESEETDMTDDVESDTDDTSSENVSKKAPNKPKPESQEDCREKYRACMDEFCLLGESEGERCACSDNINLAKSKIKVVLDLQAEADKLYTEGVDREKALALGAEKSKWLFGESEAAKKSSSKSGVNFLAWLNGEETIDGDDTESVGDDMDLGDDLYQMAAESCEAELKACGSKADREEELYSRMIVQDCKNYGSYLADQKTNAESNKRIAESAVRKARMEVLDTTNKYNRGECLLAYRSCIADKGGCGANFENCLDAALLQRRANACENVLDQCMAVRKYVEDDWKAESKTVLAEAEKYADKNMRATCMAKIQNCLEEGCSTSTNSMCLSDVNVAAGICPIITECNEKIPGLQTAVNDKLGYLQTKFCENDVDACLQDKCGQDFTKPECMSKKPYEIAKLCPQDMFPSCKNATQFDVIVQSAILQMDYQMLQGCVNYFSEQLTKVCGTDMACLPIDPEISSLSSLPEEEDGLVKLRRKIMTNAQNAVDEFFVQFEQDMTVSACADSQSQPNKQVKGKISLGASVFNTAKLLGKMAAENRAVRELDSKIAELSRKQDLETAKQTCLKTYKPEKPDSSKKNYSYIHTVSFEPSLRNCHVCRMQQVCEQGGESKASSALKAASGGLAAGAAMGTGINAGWGTAIGGAVGAVGAGVMGYMSGGEKEFCQELESCEDINM